MRAVAEWGYKGWTAELVADLPPYVAVVVCGALALLVILAAFRSRAEQGRELNFDQSPAILSKARTAIAQIAFDGRVQSANPYFCALLGLSEADIIGRPLCSLFEASDLPADKSSILELFSKSQTTLEIDFQKKGSSGSDGTLKARIGPVMDDSGAITGGVVILSDVAATKFFTSRTSAEVVSAYQSIISHNFPGVLCSFRQNADGSSKLIYGSTNFEDICGFPISQSGTGLAKCFHLVHEVDALRLLPSITEAAARMVPWSAEYRIQHPRKGVVWLEERSTPVKNEDGTTIWHGMIFDITDKKSAEQATMLNAERLATATELAKLGLFDLDLITGDVFVSREFKAIFGIAEKASVTYSEILALIHPEDQAAFAHKCHIADPEAASTPLVSEFRIIRPDGVTRWSGISSRTVTELVEGDPRPTRVIACVIDFTERIQSQEDAGLWQKLFAAPNFGLAHVRVSDGAILAVSEAFARQRGYTAGELRGRQISILLPPEHAAMWPRQMREIETTGHLVYETIHQRKDGSYFPVMKEATLLAGGNGVSSSIMCYAVDISKFRDSEIALAKSRILHHATISSLREGVITFDSNGRVLSCNPAAERILGLSVAEIQATRPDFSAWPTIAEDGSILDPADYPAVRALETGQPCEGVVLGIPNLDQAKSGTGTKWLLVNAAPVVEPFSTYARSVVASFIDITARKEAETRTAALLASLKQAQAETQVQKGLFKSIFDSAPDAIVQKDLNRRIMSVNPGFSRIFGYEISELVGQSTQPFYATREDWERVGAHIENYESDQIMSGEFAQFKRKNGETFPGQVSGAILKDEQQRALGYITIVRDITLEREREQTLHEAMRYESLGKLTSGIAHDFNNLLTVISINLQLISMAVPNQLVKRQVQSALLATSMGVKLNQRLTGLARKGTLEAVAVNLNSIVREISDVLRVAIGERSSISISLASNLWLTKAAPIEVENMLLNFAINSRDAMPSGGVLAIETFNADFGETQPNPDFAPGKYVVLRVRDTGFGMSPEVLRRATERFYTTKQSGSGLGLASVDDFVTQSNGHLSISSVEGDGTTIQVYLPAYTEMDFAVSTAALGAASSKPSPRILVVEDNKAVLDSVSEYLQSLGYQVFRALDAASALVVLSSEAEIDVVFTDVVLPGGRTGYDLGKDIADRYPKVKVLYTSGFAEHAGGRTPDSPHMLKKPYVLDDLQAELAVMLAK